MASTTGASQQGAVGVAKSREFHDKQKHCRNRTRRYRAVSEEQKQQIAVLYNSGLNGYQVAARMGLSKSAVYKHLKPRRRYTRWTEDAKEIIRQYRILGKTHKKIAMRLGCTENAVKITLCRMRQEFKNNPAKRLVSAVLGKFIKMGATPGQAINAARAADIFRRLV